MNATRLSKESGTNVSYNSNISAIKTNILKFKNKKPIKLPIPVGRVGAQTPNKKDFKTKNTSNLINQYSYNKNDNRKNNVKSMIESTPTHPLKNPKTFKTVNIELKNSSPSSRQR